jgi:hypothetical protein
VELTATKAKSMDGSSGAAAEGSPPPGAPPTTTARAQRRRRPPRCGGRGGRTEEQLCLLLQRDGNVTPRRALNCTAASISRERVGLGCDDGARAAFFVDIFSLALSSYPADRHGWVTVAGVVTFFYILVLKN